MPNPVGAALRQHQIRWIETIPWIAAFGAFFIYTAMIGLLMWRPAGLFGRA